MSRPSAQPSVAVRPVPAYPDAEVEALSKRLEDARARRHNLRSAEIASDHVDAEIRELRRQLREGGRLNPGDDLNEGRYLLVRIVGRGGFAVVWEAYDHTAEQRVAIKVLHPNLAGDLQRRERFFRGARTMMSLAHPAVVRVLEPRCVDGGFYYFVMEFMPRGNLREAVLEQRLQKADLLPLILQVGDALAMTHAMGMVHRDIKPANVLLDDLVRAKLTDFDLVGAFDTMGDSSVVGTVVYTAPECYEKPHEATARVDVWGLGMTAIFCLSGQEPSMEMMWNPAETIAKLDCSHPVREVLERAVKWKSDHRFADAAAMLDALRKALKPATQTATQEDGRTEPTSSPSGFVPQSERGWSDASGASSRDTVPAPSAATSMRPSSSPPAIQRAEVPGSDVGAARLDAAAPPPLTRAVPSVTRASKIFLSHSTADDAIVRALQRVLGDQGLDVWIDAHRLRGGDPLSPEIQRAIEEAEAFAIVVSPDALQSSWVGKELRHALLVQRQRGKDAYRVIPLSLDGTKLGVLEVIFGEPPLYVPLHSAAGGVEAALHAVLVALGKREPADVAPTPRPLAEPLEELVLELTDLRLEEIQEGARRATARARLVYAPATPGQRPVASMQSWRFVAPLGPLETEELRWYLEKYAIWPGDVFRARARKIEDNLIAWGRLLHDAAMPVAPTADVLRAWARIDGHAGRRFSVHVDASRELGASESEQSAVREAGTLLLGLPWELLHDGDSFLFQGARPTRVRRRLPNTRALDIAVVTPPIRILLICARPEDVACRYIDHRASALPLVDAMEQLPGLVELHILSPPTLPALHQELERAHVAREPYHVVHFDGHGVYDRRVGLGGLCFEHPEDVARLEDRRHQTIFTDQLGPLLRDHRIPLVVLDACQTAQAEQASESVASRMLEQGVASVVAMSHSVLVETARRFVTAFYATLARGGRVGDAMLEGQRHLKDDTRRGRIFGAGELRLEDWFVPVLFQEDEDPQLFRQTPALQTRHDFQLALRNRLGALPLAPSTGFIGRSRDLLALERLLGHERYAVLRGQGGEGKTALAAEFARWMVRSQQFQRAAFVSVEEHSTAHAVLDALGRQLVPGYSVATFVGIEQAEQPVARALREQSTVLVVDNLESILPPPYLAADALDALAEDARIELAAILALCQRLNEHGNTRLVFTSREALPAPFDSDANRRELTRLHRLDAVQLVQRVVHVGAAAASVADAELAAIEELVEAVHGHARTLALLAPSLRRAGVAVTREGLVELMVDMDRRFPGQREKSLFASVELSLRRLSPDARRRARLLGVFHGGVDVDLLRAMTESDEADAAALAHELVDTGLATPERYNHLSLDPALCPYLRHLLDDAERDALTARWGEAMRSYVDFLRRQQDQDAELAATLTRLELPNLLAFLDHIARGADAEAAVRFATEVLRLLSYLGRPHLLARVGEVRDAAAARLSSTWSRARFQTEASRIEQQLASGRWREAVAGAQALLRQTRTAGERAYEGSDYHLAMACGLLGHALQLTGGAQQALPYLDEARQRFEAIDRQRPGGDAARMAAVAAAERGDCLQDLGRLDEAAAAYEERIRSAQQQQDERGQAVAKSQLGMVRRKQRRYREALDAHAEAREYFTRLGEPGAVATVWHQLGVAYREAGEHTAAEDAYRQALAINVQLGDVRGQARALLELGNLYAELGRMEEAASLLRAAVDHAVSVGDAQLEGRCMNNLAGILRNLGRRDEARQVIHQAITWQEPSHAAEPWKTWNILALIETDFGKVELAARAKARARDCYLAYRRDGGENHFEDGRISLAVTDKLVAGDTAKAIAELDERLANPELASALRPFLVALRTIATGIRDRSPTDAPDLDYRLAAELLWVLDALEAAGAG